MTETVTINLNGHGNGKHVELLGSNGLPLNTGRSAEGKRGDNLHPLTANSRSTRSQLTREITAGGVSYFSGYIEADEFNDKLTGTDAVLMYDKMRRTDAQIQAILFAAKLPIKGAKWDVVWPEGHEGPDEQLDFLRQNLFLNQSFPQFFEHALSCLWAGFSWFEKVYEIRDGRMWLEKLAPRLATSQYRWWTDDKENLVGLRQWVQSSGFRADIPLDKIVLFSFQKEGNNFEGMSLLRGAYKHWFIKDQIYHIDAIRIERFALGVPHFKVPSENFDTKTIRDLQTVGKNWKAGEQSYLITPAEIEVDILSLSQGQVLDVIQTIHHHNEEIGKSTLTQFINLGSTQRGSRALGETNVEFFYDAIKSTAEWLAEEITEQVIKPLMDFNFPGDVRPRLVVEDIGAVGKDAVKNMLRDLGDTYVTPNLDTENYLRRLYKLPIRSEEEKQADKDEEIEDEERTADIQSRRFQPNNNAAEGGEAEPPEPPVRERPQSRPLAASQLKLHDKQFTLNADQWRSVLEKS